MRDQRGVALVVTLVLLTALGALALAAAAAAAAALALSGHQQFALIAFQAAEAGIAESLLRAAGTRSAGVIPETPFPESAPLATFAATTNEAPEDGTLPAGFTIGENAGSYASRNFFIVSDGRSGRNARVRLEQGFYLVQSGG
jgi:Tfp pilus assembly protein PilX